MQIAGFTIPILLFQIAFAIHAFRSGQPLFWLFLIIFVPVIGCILYVIIVILPEASQSRAVREGGKVLQKAIDPGKALRERKLALEISDTIGNRIELAREYEKQGMLGDAIQLYESSMTGMYRTDPELVGGLASVLIKSGDYPRALQVLDDLYVNNTDFDSPDVLLLYARCLENTGEIDKSIKYYAKAMMSFSGLEAKYRYAAILKKVGRTIEADSLFQDIVASDRINSRHSHELNREWVSLSKKELG